MGQILETNVKKVNIATHFLLTESLFINRANKIQNRTLLSNYTSMTYGILKNEKCITTE